MGILDYFHLDIGDGEVLVCSTKCFYGGPPPYLYVKHYLPNWARDLVILIFSTLEFVIKDSVQRDLPKIWSLFHEMDF